MSKPLPLTVPAAAPAPKAAPVETLYTLTFQRIGNGKYETRFVGVGGVVKVIESGCSLTVGIGALKQGVKLVMDAIAREKR